MSELILLGPQRHAITVADAVQDLELEGPFALITAGWQEREAEVEEIDAQLGQKTINLMLHQRGEAIFREDQLFREAHRVHMGQVKRMQDIYRTRLTHYMNGLHELLIRSTDLPEELVDPELEDAFETVRSLDRRHLAGLKAAHEAFRARWEPEKRDNIMDHYYELTETLERCGAVIIAGGHVAVLLNRMRLLKLEPFLREKPVIAWSAGAMCLGSQVVLFHDSPPQGPGYAEVFEAGLGLYDDVIPLPHADKRLLLDDYDRVSLFARRFNHARCLTLETGSRIDRVDGTWRGETQIRQLHQDGSVEELQQP